jgi:hypothetical protein
MEKDFMVYLNGIVNCSVCSSLSPKETLRRANLENPVGTAGRWKFTPERFATGEPNPCPCDKLPGTHKHYLLVGRERTAMMTESQARIRAKVKWGKDGYVSARRQKDGGSSFYVGMVKSAGRVRFFHVEGEGGSWEDAFAQVARQALRSACLNRAERLYDALKGLYGVAEQYWMASMHGSDMPSELQAAKALLDEIQEKVG